MIRKWRVIIVCGMWPLTVLAADPSPAQKSSAAEVDWQVASNSETKASVKVRGLEKPAQVESYTKAMHYKKGALVQQQSLGIFRDPGTGYIWWVVRDRLPNQVLEEYAAEIWLIPEVGFARFQVFSDVILADISSVKTQNYQDGLEKALAYLNAQAKGETSDGERRERRVMLAHIIGDDFFFKKGDAAPPPRAKIVALAFASGIWHVELQSALTQENATVDLDSALKVMSATRNGQKVYPKAGS